ncbi:MAG: carboxymuconolactone decarboxylase family protein [Phycisphaerales bacterium]
MNARLDYAKASPGGFQAMMAVEKHVRGAVDSAILHLVKLRASQINGCAFCIDMHWKDARAAGESEQRLYALDAWRESPFYSDRERAALAWTEALTLVSQTHAPDAEFDAARAHFADRELADLTWAIAAINAWNRIGIAFRSVPGAYQPPKVHASA